MTVAISRRDVIIYRMAHEEKPTGYKPIESFLGIIVPILAGLLVCTFALLTNQ
ncbi:MAG: hypothetical protein OHK005_21450 [Candidatus Methylacidiphilales bacterium]